MIGVGWLLFASGVILVGLLVAVTRMLMPLLDDYRNDIQKIASEQLGRPVRIGRVTGGWSGLDPRLSFIDVTIYRPDGKAVWLHVGKIQASVDLLRSIVNRRIETGHIDVEGLNVNIERDRDGAYAVSGFKTGRGGFAGYGGKRLLAWLVARERISILHSDISWKDPRLSRETLHLTKVDLRMDKVGDQYRLDGAARLANQGTRELSFILYLSGDASRPETLRSRFYLSGGLELGPWLNGSILSKTRVTGGELDFKLWGEGGDQLEHLAGTVAVHDLQWSHTMPVTHEPSLVSPSTFSLDRLSTRLFWHKLGDGWVVNLEGLQVARGGLRWPESNARVVYRRSQPGGRRQLQGRFGFVRLQDLSAFLQALAGTDASVRAALSAMRPRGDLRDFVFDLRDPPNPGAVVPQFFLRARFQGLGVDRWGRLPAVSGLDGHFVMNQDRGFMMLDSHDTRVDVPALFATPIAVTKLGGQVYWRRRASHWRLGGRNLHASNQDIRGHGRFNMEVPLGGGMPFLDLQLAYQDGDVSQAYKYLPRRVMKPKVVAWLDRALAGGRLTSGRLLYFGKVTDFPFDAGQGVLEASFGVEDGILDYHPGWPRAEDLAAEVSFHNRSMQAKIAYGKIFDLDVQPSSVVVDDLSKRGAVEVHANVDGPMKDFMRYLRENPLTGAPREHLSAFKTAGKARLNADIHLPIDAVEDGTVTGKVRLEDAAFGLPQWKVKLSGLQGMLGFDASRSGVAFRAKRIAVRFRQRPGHLDISTVTDKGDRYSDLTLHTHSSAALLAGTDAGPLPAYMSGEADWRVQVRVRHPRDGAGIGVGLQVTSPLRGIRVNLPEWLAKPANEARTLSVSTSISAGGIGPVHLDYGKGLRSVLVFDRGGGFKRGTLQFGGKPAPAPTQPGLVIAGDMDAFSLSRWQRWDGKYGHNAGQKGVLPLVSALDVRMQRLELFNRQFHQVTLNARDQAQGWRATVHSRELAGRVLIPDDLSGSDPLVLDLDRLHLALAGGAGKLPSPLDMPPLRVSCKSFQYNELNLGRLKLLARRQAKGLDLENVQVTSPYFDIKATGAWTIQGGAQRTRLYVKASANDLGEALKRLGYASGINGGSATAQAELDWPGQPAAFQLKDLNGRISLSVARGRLLDIDPGGGRVFGLLSLQALPRRLSLDFSDLFGKGFSFDRIEGNFAISDGDAFTNDLYMTGPAAKIDISGRIGLAARDYDETAVVTPQVTSSLPLVGGLAGGPGVGLGLWVAERMFGKKIDRMSRSYYTITGSWDKPKVERMGAGESKSGTSP
ncbi:MAG: YhdP family protein [Gammaproteobacteria bacterium]